MKKNKFSFLKHPNCGWHNLYFYYLYFSNINKYLRRCDKGKVLDLGSGDGHYKNLLTRFELEYESVDWTESPHAGSPDILADLNKKLPIENSYCNNIFCLSVLEHLSEPKLFLNECSRILKQDGKLILQVPFMWQVHEAPHDYFRYTEYGLKHLLSDSGFQILDMTPQGGVFITLTMKILYQANRLIPKKIKKFLNLVLFPIGAIVYTFAHFIDMFSKSVGETSGYILLAKKL